MTGRARALLDDSLLQETFAAVEKQSFEDALQAKTDEERATHLNEVKALRSVLSKLKNRAARDEHSLKK